MVAEVAENYHLLAIPKSSKCGSVPLKKPEIEKIYSLVVGPGYYNIFEASTKCEEDEFFIKSRNWTPLGSACTKSEATHQCKTEGDEECSKSLLDASFLSEKRQVGTEEHSPLSVLQHVLGQSTLSGSGDEECNNKDPQDAPDISEKPKAGKAKLPPDSTFDGVLGQCDASANGNEDWNKSSPDAAHFSQEPQAHGEKLPEDSSLDKKLAHSTIRATEATDEKQKKKGQQKQEHSSSPKTAAIKPRIGGKQKYLRSSNSNPVQKKETASSSKRDRLFERKLCKQPKHRAEKQVGYLSENGCIKYEEYGTPFDYDEEEESYTPGSEADGSAGARQIWLIPSENRKFGTITGKPPHGSVEHITFLSEDDCFDYISRGMPLDIQEEKSNASGLEANVKSDLQIKPDCPRNKSSPCVRKITKHTERSHLGSSGNHTPKPLGKKQIKAKVDCWLKNPLLLKGGSGNFKEHPGALKSNSLLEQASTGDEKCNWSSSDGALLSEISQELLPDSIFSQMLGQCEMSENEQPKHPAKRQIGFLTEDGYIEYEEYGTPFDDEEENNTPGFKAHGSAGARQMWLIPSENDKFVITTSKPPRGAVEQITFLSEDDSFDYVSYGTPFDVEEEKSNPSDLETDAKEKKKSGKPVSLKETSSSASWKHACRFDAEHTSHFTEVKKPRGPSRARFGNETKRMSGLIKKCNSCSCTSSCIAARK